MNTKNTKIGLFAIALVVVFSGCVTVVDEPHGRSSVAPITSSELIAFVNSQNGFHSNCFNGFTVSEVMAAHDATIQDLRGKLGIDYRIAWNDGVYYVDLGDERDWRIRHNFAVLDGKIIGTVSEVRYQ